MVALEVRCFATEKGALLRHLLVVDEVHASDPYMTALLQSLLQMHLDAGGHALLMSATLGSAARRAYLLGPRAAHPDLLRAIAAPYPCLRSAEDGVTHAPPASIASRCAGRVTPSP